MISETPGIKGENAVGAVEDLIKICDRQFSAFEGKPVLAGSTGKRCYARCLSFQASMAQRLATEKGWISIDQVVSPAFSELGENKTKQMKEWFSAWKLKLDIDTDDSE